MVRRRHAADRSTGPAYASSREYWTATRPVSRSVEHEQARALANLRRTLTEAARQQAPARLVRVAA